MFFFPRDALLLIMRLDKSGGKMANAVHILYFFGKLQT